MSKTCILALAFGAALAAAAPARAEEAKPDPAAEQRKALDEARENLKASEERKQAIAAEIAALKGERGKLQQSMVDTVASIRDHEPKIQEREKRLGEMAESERQLRVSLVKRRDVLADVIAALQRMGRQPPPALLVRPNDALEAIRSAILLGAVVPEMRAEAESLGSDLREMVRLRELMTAERDTLKHEVTELTTEREKLTALMDERQRQQGERETDLGAESDKIGSMSRDVANLEGLIEKMEQDQAKAASEAAKAAPAPDPNKKVDLASLQDPSRLSPAVPFERTRGQLPFPVSGQRVKAFGDSAGGGSSQGVSIAAAPGSPVTAPCDGWVVYAGPFRSYGQLLILNAGGGYHILLAGMERITVGLNQFVLAGEPVAVMRGEPGSSGKPSSPAERPVLYVEFRKDRGSIDPSPWWAGTPGEKVGG